jgi:hypothetical protein
MEGVGLQTLLGYINNLKKASLHEEFKPDYTPAELKEMGAYGEVYGPKTAPRLASLPAWPSHWYHKEDPHGWLQWYKRYSEGRRMEDDERQIRRWKAFKARHGGPAFQGNPTPRRAFALRNWGIDASKLVKDPESLQKVMEEYRAKQYEKAASTSILKVATTLGATKALLRMLRSEGVQLHRTSKPLAKIMAEEQFKTISTNMRNPEFMKNLGAKTGLGESVKKYTPSKSQLRQATEMGLEMTGPTFIPQSNRIFIPKGEFVKGVGRKSWTADGASGEKISLNPRETFFHEGGHAIHYNEDPAIHALTEARGGHILGLNSNTLTTERIANNNAINFMREQKVTGANINNYVKNIQPGYKSYLDGYQQIQKAPKGVLPFAKPKIPFSQIPKDHFSVALPQEAKTVPVSFPAPIAPPTL